MKLSELSLSEVRRSVRRTGRRALLQAILASRRRKSTDRPLPDFVLVGAMRCGTTSLFHALNQHPAVMPNVLQAKGIHYFDNDYYQPLDWYRAHFPTADERTVRSRELGHQAQVGDFSPYYMHHPTALERMASHLPDAKILVLLRDPVQRAISHHQHMVNKGHESVTAIDRALDLEPTRIAGEAERLAADARYRSLAHQHYGYVARGHYVDQLERLFMLYPRDQILVTATENLASGSGDYLAHILRFLGLPPAPITFERRNASPSADVSPATVERLSEAFAASNRRLSAMADLDLPWL